MDLYEKFYIARKLLSLKQKEASEKSGVRQAIISIIERGGGEEMQYPMNILSFFTKKELI